MTLVHGVIDDSDITARILFPTREREPFLPFERFAESVATSRKKGDLHAHLGQEVVTYVLEGHIEHEYGAGVHDNLTEGSILVLTASDEVRHWSSTTLVASSYERVRQMTTLFARCLRT